MSEVAVRTWESLAVGETARIERTISQDDIVAFGTLSGDTNPLHIQEGVVHGMYLASLVSALVGMQLPGERSLLVKESLSFKKSVMGGDTVEVLGTLTHKSEATRMITVAITITVSGESRVEGEVQVQVRI